MRDISDVVGFETFVKTVQIQKGWSSDEKYYIETNDGRHLFLRVGNISEYEHKKMEFQMMEQVFALGVPMSQPIKLGRCDRDNCVYSLLSWKDGEDAEKILPMLTETQQYIYGLESGEILKDIHMIHAPDDMEDWAVSFNRKTNTRIQKYLECGISFDGDQKMIQYIEENRHLLENRPQCYQHGDYHIGNMIIAPDNSLSIIDFNRSDFGDPWEEFTRIVWSASVSPHFATGQLIGYFGGRPPVAFFQLLAFYISSNALSSIYWSISFGQEEINIAIKQTQEILTWFEDMKNFMPTWYLKNFYVQYTDGIPYKLKHFYDLSFLRQYGKVFKVFDDQDSGNICFGVQSEFSVEEGVLPSAHADKENKYFLKFAGAPTDRGICSKDEAIRTLREALFCYQDLAHENLIKLIGDEEVGDGYVAIFQWSEALCMGSMYPNSHQKFMGLPFVEKIQIFEDILKFHMFVHEKGYVAIDFYDGSIMYDVECAKTIICDIDFYTKKPYINKLGRLWGSARFMSPEEFVLGAEIDEITNVYTMGATAFALFSNYDFSVESWPLSKALYAVVKKAVNNEKALRQQSIQQLFEEWGGAKD